MKLQVTYDKQGNILALAPVTRAGKASLSRPYKDRTIDELEVPDGHTDAPLLTIHKELRVDVASPKRLLVPKK